MTRPHEGVIDRLVEQANQEGHGDHCRCTMCLLLLEVLNGLCEPRQRYALPEFAPVLTELYAWIGKV